MLCDEQADERFRSHRCQGYIVRVHFDCVEAIFAQAVGLAEKHAFGQPLCKQGLIGGGAL
jgi:hypothetical protein